jgi:EVE domain
MHNFILVCTDAVSPRGKRLSAEAQAEARLRAGRWPLYTGTPHQGRMAPGDRLLVYLGGARPGAQSFYAIAEVSLIETVQRRKESRSEGDYLEGHQPASSWLLLKSIRRLSPRVSVRELLPRLSFLPKTPNRWGVAFMSGVRILSDADWEVIVADGAASAA